MLSKEQSDDAHKGFRIVFESDNVETELFTKIYQQNEKDHLLIGITQIKQDAHYYEDTYTKQTIGPAFMTIYESLPDLYQYIGLNFETMLDVEFAAPPENRATLKLKIQIGSKIRQTQLVIGQKLMPQMMKDQINLRKITKEFQLRSEEADSLLELEKELKQKVETTSNQLQILRKHIEQMKEKYFARVEAKKKLRLQLTEVDNAIDTHQTQLEEMYRQLEQKGIRPNEEELMNYHCSQGNKRIKMAQLGASKKVLLVNRADCLRKQSVEVIDKPVQIQLPHSNFQHPSHKEDLQQPISSSFELINEQKEPLINSDYNNSPELAQFVNEVLQSQTIKDQSNNQKAFQIHSDALLPNELNTIMQERVLFEQSQPSKCNLQYVTVLSSQSEQQDGVLSEKWGRKVNLDFSESDHIQKYKIQHVKSKTIIERIFDDKNFYNLHHTHPIQGKQYMQINISKLAMHDFTFGIMAGSALKVSRLEWPKAVICLIGCAKQVVNQFEIRKLKKDISYSDSIVVSADLQEGAVSFYQNNALIDCELIAESMKNDCYFFIETATAGNQIFYK